MEPLNIILREAQHSDLPEIQQLCVDTVAAVCKSDYDSEQIKVWISLLQNEERWLNILKQQYFIVAELNSRIVGFTSLDRSYIDVLFVHKDFQGKGIAGRLMDQLVEHARTLGIQLLSSNVSKTAKGFFENTGFKVIEEQHNQIQGVEIVNYEMSKRL